MTPAFVYSSKTTFPEREVNAIIHVIDWMPTLLWFAKAPIPTDIHIDGMMQHVHIRRPADSISKDKRRKKFIYGVLHYDVWSRMNTTVRYAARYGKYKFYNYRRDIETTTCNMTDADVLRQICPGKKFPEVCQISGLRLRTLIPYLDFVSVAERCLILYFLEIHGKGQKKISFGRKWL